MAKVERSVKDRTGIIGCSQLGQLLNVSSYGTPYNVYRDYIGEPREEVVPEIQESMDMGTFFEEHIANYAAKKYKLKIRRSNKAFIHPKLSNFICHPDRIICGKIDGLRVGMEIKLVQPFSPGWGEPDTDEVPDDYLLQCEGYIACEVCDVVWLFVMKGNRIIRYIITKDEALVKVIEDAVEDFTTLVASGKVLEPDTYELVCKKYNHADQEKTIKADDDMVCTFNEYKEIELNSKQLKDKLDKIKGEIALYMKENYRLEDAIGNKLVIFANSNSSSFNKKLFEEDHPGMYAEYTDKKITRRMTFAKR
jgi:predicted phage-related endonuclease